MHDGGEGGHFESISESPVMEIQLICSNKVFAVHLRTDLADWPDTEGLIFVSVTFLGFLPSLALDPSPGTLKAHNCK
jgi:hypothetical protein